MGSHTFSLIAGIIIIYVGSEWLIKGAAGLARASGLSPLLLGLTAIAYGTSAPELFVAAQAALMGKPDIAIGNVLGSNLGNFGLILGLTALICPIQINWKQIRFEYLKAGVLAFLILMMTWLGFSKRHGLFLFVFALFYFLFTLFTSRQSARTEISQIEEDATTAGAPSTKSPWILLLIFICGTVMLAVGGDMLLEYALRIGNEIGLNEMTIGMTVVAFATTLPELMTSILAARRGQPEIAIASILGSTIFNSSVVLGLVAFIKPSSIVPDDIWFQWTSMALMMALSAFLIYTGKKLTRFEGLLLALFHIGVLVFTVLKDAL